MTLSRHLPADICFIAFFLLLFHSRQVLAMLDVTGHESKQGKQFDALPGHFG
jgi:hypothetical protein